MTRKDVQQRLARARREQQAAQAAVREANARVVEATRKLPPLYVDEHRRFAPGERARIEGLVARAQKEGDRLGVATADVVNLQRLLQSQEASPRRGHHATKKSPAQLQREIEEVLAKVPAKAKAAKVIVYSRPSGYWYAQAHDPATGARITDAAGYSREDVLRELGGKFAMIGVTIESITDEDPDEFPLKPPRPPKKKSPAPRRNHSMIKGSPLAFNPEFLAGLDRAGLRRALQLLRRQDTHPGESNPAAAQYEGLATTNSVRAEYRRRGWKVPKPTLAERVR